MGRHRLVDHFKPERQDGSVLTSVSCLSTISCTAVGYSSSNGTTYQTLVEPRPRLSVFTSPNNVTFTENVLGTFAPKAHGSPTPTITESGSLPRGVSFIRGKLHGTPTLNGTFHLTFTAKNGVAPNAMQNFPSEGARLHHCCQDTAQRQIGKPYSATLSAMVNSPLHMDASEVGRNLPKGLALRQDDISGTPTQRGTLQFTVQVAEEKVWGSVGNCSV